MSRKWIVITSFMVFGLVAVAIGVIFGNSGMNETFMPQNESVSP